MWRGIKRIIRIVLWLCGTFAVTVAAERFALAAELVTGSKREVFLRLLPYTVLTAIVLAAGSALLRKMGRMTLKKLDVMFGNEFEYACAGILRANGFKNVRVTQASGDFGVDITAQKNHVSYAVQCKRYEKKVNNSAIQEVIGGLAVYGCEVGAVMTNSYFTEPAKRLAEANGVILWDRDALAEMLDRSGTKKAVRQSLADSEQLDDPEAVCGCVIDDYLSENGIGAEVENIEVLEDSCELLVELKLLQGVRIDDIRAVTDDLAAYGGWEYVTCVFPSKTAGRVGLEIPLPLDEEDV